MTLPTSLLSSARACLEELSTRRPTREEARAIRLLVAPPKARRAVKASRKRRKSKRLLAREHRAGVYAAVDARSGGDCELDTCAAAADEHDHFWGSGKEIETVENVWHLCKLHHDRKTANEPRRARWIVAFRWHCAGYGYIGEVAKCDRALALEAAQHPAAAHTRKEESGR